MRGRPAHGAAGAAPSWLHAPGGRLRAFWRLTLYTLALVVAGLVSQTLLYPLLAALASAAGTRLGAAYWLPSADLLNLAAIVLAHTLMLKWIEHRPWRDVGLGRDGLRPAALSTGAALGAYSARASAAPARGASSLGRSLSRRAPR